MFGNIEIDKTCATKKNPVKVIPATCIVLRKSSSRDAKLCSAKAKTLQD